jgi:hypothetical protein
MCEWQKVLKMCPYESFSVRLATAALAWYSIGAESDHRRRVQLVRDLMSPGGHPNSPTCGHPKLPHSSGSISGALA